MERLVKRCGNNPAVPTGFDLDFIFDLADKENEGLQAVFDRLCELEEKIEKGELLEVVRCRDCKYWTYDNYHKHNYCSNKFGLRYVCPENNFCSYGERREGE